mgnify:CR=1 FL=1
MNAYHIKQLAKKEGLVIIENTLKLNNSGVDFIVGHAKDKNGDHWIIRVPRRKQSMRNAIQEKQALDILNRNASFQVPNWSIFSDDIIAYKALSGVPAATIDVEKQGYIWSFDEANVPNEYYHSLGKALAELHSLPQHEFESSRVEKLTAKNLRMSMKQRMDRVKEQYTINPKLWDRWQAWLAEDLWPSHVGVIHGDLHPGHILINKNNSVTGFIDWTEIGVGDVSVDFLSHLLLFGKEGLTKLIDAYENAGGKTWPGMTKHMEELLTTSAITVAEYAETSGLEEMRETAKQMLSNG